MAVDRDALAVDGKSLVVRPACGKSLRGLEEPSAGERPIAQKL